MCVDASEKNLPAPDIADLIGWNVSSVRRVHAQYYKDGDKIFKGVGRGGRHRENLSKEEEKKLLNRFFDKAGDGSILVVNEIKLAYEQLEGSEADRLPNACPPRLEKDCPLSSSP